MLISFSAKVDGHTIEYIVSSRGKLQLCVDGYAYYRNKAERNMQSFYCIQYKHFRFVSNLRKIANPPKISSTHHHIIYRLGAQQKFGHTKIIVLKLCPWSIIIRFMCRDENGARVARSRCANLNWIFYLVKINWYCCRILLL